MKKKELAGALARRSGVSRAAAADRLDRVVTDILLRLRRGEPVSLPGLGTFVPGQEISFRSDAQERRK